MKLEELLKLNIDDRLIQARIPEENSIFNQFRKFIFREEEKK